MKLVKLHNDSINSPFSLFRLVNATGKTELRSILWSTDSAFNQRGKESTLRQRTIVVVRWMAYIDYNG